ncbi:hypothetical protein SASPL_137726 [Salvia splendens]|uniref:Uncharacterized protein n=1 Tax=Salvia splendens TaxID=180675 RepID=A0A8X8WTW1_SALSN|nr:hypothetical protein SASPL_137726 [Salvia splendens]
MKESVLRINDPEADKQAEEQTAEEPKKGPASKNVTKEKVNKGNEKVGERVEKEETYDEKIRHETLKLKTSPRKIIELFQSLNEEQLNEVIDIGFGELQHFGIAEVPGKMAYDLVKGFNNAFYVDRIFHQKILVSHNFPTVFGWTSEKLRLREKMELESSHTIGRGSLVERGDPDKLPCPSGILVFEETETAEKDQWEVAIEGFATASEDAVRVLQNMLLSGGGWGRNSDISQAALANDNFNSPELVEAMKSMFKVTAQLTKLAEEGPPFDIHPSFEQKNSVAEISSFTAVGMIQSSNTEKLVISVGSEEARLCASKSDKQERNNIVGTINVEEIVKSAMADYMDGGGDDAADEFYSEASGTKTKTSLDNQLRSNDETNGEELDVEAIVKSAVEAYMECDEDFVTPFTNKSEPKLGEALVIYANKQLYTVVMSNGRDDDADKLDEFASNIDKEVSEIPHFAWGDIDMVFFAFCVSKRYYTVCFCFKRRSVVIIDACKDGEDNDLRFTYSCIPDALV